MVDAVINGGPVYLWFLGEGWGRRPFLESANRYAAGR